MNVVSIMAHQDDEMQCLGTLLKCRARGDRISFVTLTDGAKGFVQQPDIDPAEAARIRHAEMSALAQRLDADYINLREPDEFLYDTPDVRMKLIEAIRQTQAVKFVPNSYWPALRQIKRLVSWSTSSASARLGTRVRT